MTWFANPAYNTSTNSIRQQVINPVSQDYVSETLAALTLQTGAPTTFYYYVDMAGFRKGGFQFELDGGTALNTMVITCWGTLQDDGTAPASCTYQDITSDTFGVANLSCAGGATLSDMWIDNAEKLALYKYVRLNVLLDTTAGANDAGWTIYHQRLY